MTNAEKIRQRTDEELLDFLKNFAAINGLYRSVTLCATYEVTECCERFHENCEECLFSWLKEEASDD